VSGVRGLDRLLAARDRPHRIVVGLISGTSADGIDACVARIAGAGATTRATTLRALTVPYPDDVREAVLALHHGTAADAARWDVRLGERFAAAALAVLEAAGMTPSDADLIGSHGQTILHLPDERATSQIGDPAVLAERTGLPVVADFRRRDLAAGGEGAPLVPWADWLTLRPESGSRIVQNLGGVANATFVTQDPGDVLAFDVGPANAPIDAAAALASGGRLRCDLGGRLAAAGHPDEALVGRLLREDEFLRRAPPKSASRERWGEDAIATFAAANPGLAGPDLVATVTEFVARALVDGHRRFLPLDRVGDVVVSGGGVHNPALLGRIAELLAPLPVRSSAALGIDPDAREALAFAVLANETLHGNPGNLPRVTGARRAVPLGSIVL